MAQQGFENRPETVIARPRVKYLQRRRCLLALLGCDIFRNWPGV